jgi:hypothetical protein
MGRAHKAGVIPPAAELAFPPDPRSGFHGPGINDFRILGPGGNDLLKKAIQFLVSGFWFWFHDAFLPGKFCLSEIRAQGAYFFVAKYFRTASSMRSSGSSFFTNWSARSIGKRRRRTRVSSSTSMYFFKKGTRTSQTFFFSFLLLWINSSQSSLSPLMLMVSFITLARGRSCI